MDLSFWVVHVPTIKELTNGKNMLDFAHVFVVISAKENFSFLWKFSQFEKIFSLKQAQGVMIISKFNVHCIL